MRRPGHEPRPAFEAGACPQDDGAWLVTVRGELDLFTAPKLRAAVSEALDARPRRLVFDLCGVTELDSSGLAVFVMAHRRLAPLGSEVRIVVADDDTAMKFRLTGLDQILDVSCDGADGREARARAARPPRGEEGDRPSAP